MTFVYALDHPHELPAAEVTALVGGKAANLGVMLRELRLPVPPGIVITTAACRAYLASGWPAGLDGEIRAGLAEVERRVGRRFGDPADPLLVSVRSGAPVAGSRVKTTPVAESGPRLPKTMAWMVTQVPASSGIPSRCR